MITPVELRDFLGTAGADFSENQLREAITLAIQRFKKLTSRDPSPSSSVDKKALLLLSAIEVASQINLYYRKEASEIIRVKDLASEVERLLGLSPQGNLLWQKL